jgi:hypothetical protein
VQIDSIISVCVCGGGGGGLASKRLIRETPDPAHHGPQGCSKGNPRGGLIAH